MSGSRAIPKKKSKMTTNYVKISIYRAVGRIEKQGFALYYEFSGQGMQINLCRIDEIKGKQDGGQVAQIYKNGEIFGHLRFTSKEIVTGHLDTWNLKQQQNQGKVDLGERLFKFPMCF